MTRPTSLLLCIAALWPALACSSEDDTPDGTAEAPPAATVEPLRGGAAVLAAIPPVEWVACGNGLECANVDVPLDYSLPEGPTLTLALARSRSRDPAQRIGSLFLNFGGPGVPTIDLFFGGAASYFAVLNPRFDIVGFDPRGIGRSQGAIDCKQSPAMKEGPFDTPENFNREAWVQSAQQYVDTCMANNPEGFAAHVSTSDAARDMDVLRAAVGDEKLTFLGKSYGSLLGATYASLFPDNYRALVLDGGINPDEILNRPMDSIRLQTLALERALDHFFEACAANQTACFGFGGESPRAAFEALVAQASGAAIPALGSHPEPIRGDDILAAAAGSLYEKRDWQPFAAALVEAQAGDATRVRALVDEDLGWLEGGSYDPAADRAFTIVAAEQNYGPDLDTYVAAGELAWSRFPHFWWNGGYSELAYGLFPVEAEQVFRGPFRASSDAAPVLVLSTLYDPSTPHEDGLALVEQLGNAQLLIMNGDGHTAYGGRSACIDAAVSAYLTQGSLPASGSECPDEVSFAQAATLPPRAANGRSAHSSYGATGWRLPRALRRGH